MKNIAFIIKIKKNYGGAERRYANLINYLSFDSGISITLIMIGKKKVVDKFIKDHIKNSKNIFIYIKNSIINVLFLLNSNIDILQFISVNISFIPLYCFLLLKKKFYLILSLNSYDICIGRFNSNLQKIAFSILIRSVDSIDCLYPNYDEKLKITIQNLLKKPHRILMTFPDCSFIDLNKFKADINDKENIILFAARLISQKNPIIALEAIKRCKETIVNNKYQVVFAGGGPLFDEVKKYIQKNKLDEIVKMTGNIDITNYINKSKIFLSIQDIENYPSQALMEGIASGNYVIASNVGHTNNIVKEKFGKLINLNEINLTNAMIDAINITKENSSMKDIVFEARNFAINRFDIKNYANYIKTLWQNSESKIKIRK